MAHTRGKARLELVQDRCGDGVDGQISGCRDRDPGKFHQFRPRTDDPFRAMDNGFRIDGEEACVEAARKTGRRYRARNKSQGRKIGADVVFGKGGPHTFGFRLWPRPP